jgi:ERCC4-type nuclease
MRTILIDIHEPSEIEEGLRRLGLPIERCSLKVGDYCLGDIGVERKEIGDLHSSLCSGRVFEQVKGLVQAYPRKLLLIEGTITPSLFLRSGTPKERLEEKIRLFSKQLWGFQTGLFLAYGLPVYQVPDKEGTVYFLANLYTKLTKKEPFQPPLPIYKRSRSLLEVREDILCMVDGVGRKKAKLLLEHFGGSIAKIVQSSEEELSQVKGIGKNLARRIKEVFGGVENGNK